ncbi:MAG: DUF2164 family protein [Planctomycetota bacterium]|jgi:uncharacterized protein (DUF2164 family)|nr:DUF2164 family protein [Planctomycetota bacterium]MDG2143821.1 DUF2164 family protein [Planctomycetota bacterium]
MPNDTGPLRIRLSDNRRGALKRDLSAYFEAQFGDPMSDFRADELVGFFMKHLGPQVYNQAIADARQPSKFCPLMSCEQRSIRLSLSGVLEAQEERSTLTAST